MNPQPLVTCESRTRGTRRLESEYCTDRLKLLSQLVPYSDSKIPKIHERQY